MVTTSSKAPSIRQAIEHGDGKDIQATPGSAFVGYEATPIDPEVAKRVVRKIDRFLMPAMVIGYGMVYWDKVSLQSLASQGRQNRD